MQVAVLQHVPFEDIGSMRGWLTARGATLHYCRLFAGDPLPDPADLDLLIIMGGPMSVNDEALHPWLVAEKAFVRAALAAKVPTLGVCLGAQLIASALGAAIYPNGEKEIGWFPVNGLDAGCGTFTFPETSNVFHWHGETFDLPPGAVRLASSAACRNQAFQIGFNVIGLQFHLETTPQSLDAIVSNCRDELIPGRYIASEEVLRSTDFATYDAANQLMASILGFVSGRFDS